MPIYIYGVIGYVVVINIITLGIYLIEAAKPTRRTSPVILILLPIVGGSLGAVLGNYFGNTSIKVRQHYMVSRVLTFLPPIMLIVHLYLIAYLNDVKNIFSFIWNFTYETAGVIGCAFLILNTIAFVFVVIKELGDYLMPHSYEIMPDKILVPIVILGGAPGTLLAKIIFNFKYYGANNVGLKIPNFIYSIGVYIFTIVQIAGLLYLLKII